MELPGIVPEVDFDKEFHLNHEAAYKEMMIEALMVWQEVIDNGGTNHAAREATKHFIQSHPFFNPLAALNLAAAPGRHD